MKLALLLTVVAAVAVGTATAGVPRYPVVTLKTSQYGKVLAGSNKIALYTWDREKGGTIRCTGSCAKSWPPLLLPKGVMAKHSVKGIPGTFGDVRRANGRMQLTYKGHALYSYEGDGPGRVKCDGVDGWHVVRLS